MRKSLVLLIVSIFLISFISADVISVTPTRFTLDAMPGDVITKNITITTDGNRLVYLNVTSEANITLNYSTPLIVESNKTIEVQFIIPTGIIIDSYDIYLTASTDNTETIVTNTVYTSSGSSGGGGGTYTRLIYVLPNGSTTYIKPIGNFTVDVIYLTADDDTDTDTDTDTETETDIDLSTIKKVIIILVILSVLAGVGYIIYQKNTAVGEYEYE